MWKQLMYSYQERTAANIHKTDLINTKALDHTRPGSYQKHQWLFITAHNHRKYAITGFLATEKCWPLFNMPKQNFRWVITMCFITACCSDVTWTPCEQLSRSETLIRCDYMTGQTREQLPGISVNYVWITYPRTTPMKCQGRACLDQCRH